MPHRPGLTDEFAERYSPERAGLSGGLAVSLGCRSRKVESNDAQFGLANRPFLSVERQ
jgi:hypothetical protein